jgi:hypothetical protein
VRDEQRIHACLAAIKSAVPLTTDEGVMMPNALMAQALMAQLRILLAAIERFDHAIAERAQRHLDDALFDALPGAGPA